MRKFEKISSLTLTGGIIAGFIVVALMILRIGSACTSCVSGSNLYAFGALLGAYFILLAAIVGVRYFRIERVAFNLENQPITTVDAAVNNSSFAGSGTIVADQSLNSPYGQKPCVYYRTHLEELRGIKRKSWHTTHEETKFIPFEIEDHRGRLTIDLTNVDYDNMGSVPKNLINTKYTNHHYSQIECKEIFYQEEFTVSKKALGGFLSLTNKMRKTEYILPIGHTVNVFGYTNVREGQLALRESKNFPLIITDHPHKLFINQFQQGRFLLYTCPLLTLAGIIMVLMYGLALQWITTSIFIVLVASSVILCLLFIGIFVFNRMVIEFHRADNAKGNLSGELRRRQDLIANLVTASQEYAIIEKNILTKLTNQRLRVSMSNDLNVEDVSLIGIAELLAENYPDLKSNELYSEILHHLSDTESRIAYARKFHNENVLTYNQYIEMFPHNILAYIVGFKKKQYFTIIDENQKSSNIVPRSLQS